MLTNSIYDTILEEFRNIKKKRLTNMLTKSKYGTILVEFRNIRYKNHLKIDEHRNDSNYTLVLNHV